MSQDRTTRTATAHQTHPTVFSEALRRARTAAMVRPVRRTLGEMDPGFTRQPILRLAPSVRFLPTTAVEPCIFCERTSCDGMCNPFAPVPTRASAAKAVA
ncbi:hypothetical protein [Streptomyces gardneri]|uniref:hypothetical protein n=1 Tax=Streptomyces gardneri TaxID=66892 RepID=UPI0035D6F106